MYGLEDDELQQAEEGGLESQEIDEQDAWCVLWKHSAARLRAGRGERRQLNTRRRRSPPPAACLAAGGRLPAACCMLLPGVSRGAVDLALQLCCAAPRCR